MATDLVWDEDVSDKSSFLNPAMRIPEDFFS